MPSVSIMTDRFADAAEFSFSCPSVLTTGKGKPLEDEEFALKAPAEGSGSLHVKARLRYRKADQFLLNFLFGEDSGLTATITDMSEDEAVIALAPRS